MESMVIWDVDSRPPFNGDELHHSVDSSTTPFLLFSYVFNNMGRVYLGADIFFTTWHQKQRVDWHRESKKERSSFVSHRIRMCDPEFSIWVDFESPIALEWSYGTFFSKAAFMMCCFFHSIPLRALSRVSSCFACKANQKRRGGWIWMDGWSHQEWTHSSGSFI